MSYYIGIMTVYCPISSIFGRPDIVRLDGNMQDEFLQLHRYQLIIVTFVHQARYYHAMTI